jgi:hypothetical protein
LGVLKAGLIGEINYYCLSKKDFVLVLRVSEILHYYSLITQLTLKLISQPKIHK